MTRQLSERLGESEVTAHHGSLAKEQRLDAEQRLKRGELQALVATASLELGIDIGDVDLVCQIGSPRSIASFLQRVGRSGHAVGGTPKGRLFPLSRDELVECTALLDSVRRGELDQLQIPEHRSTCWRSRSWRRPRRRNGARTSCSPSSGGPGPIATLPREDFAAVVTMLAEGFSTRRGRRGALIHHDAVNHRLRGRRGARLTALTSGGTIPDNADYQVMLEPESQFIGTVNEDFAVESMAGDIFQLGNASYRILRVERGIVRVEDAHGQPPTIPFWLGEAPGRSDELSQSVSRLRAEIAARLPADAERRRRGALADRRDSVSTRPAAEQLVEYLAAAHAALGCLPTQDTIVLERFFDEVGGMQLVIHSPYGSRLNRAWGLALRKRFCRKFNFELQAAATEDDIVLSLTTAHSFDLDDVKRYLNSASVRELLIQALLDAPMFNTRWRWVGGVVAGAAALPRRQEGAAAARAHGCRGPDRRGLPGPDRLRREPGRASARFPIIRWCARPSPTACTRRWTSTGWSGCCGGSSPATIDVVARDLTEPSPLALEVLSARPYAYLDDAPLEERRTQAVMGRRWLAPEDAADIGRLDPEAIARVRAEAWPEAANADELHDALVWLGFLSAEEAEAQPGWNDWLAALARDKRVAQLAAPQARALDRRRAPAAIPGTLAPSEPRSRDRRAGRIWRARVVER